MLRALVIILLFWPSVANGKCRTYMAPPESGLEKTYLYLFNDGAILSDKNGAVFHTKVPCPWQTESTCFGILLGQVTIEAVVATDGSAVVYMGGTAEDDIYLWPAVCGSGHEEAPRFYDRAG